MEMDLDTTAGVELKRLDAEAVLPGLGFMALKGVLIIIHRTSVDNRNQKKNYDVLKYILRTELRTQVRTKVHAHSWS